MASLSRLDHTNFTPTLLRLSGDGASQMASKVASAAQSGADATTSMVAQAGRSSYVPAGDMASVPDPGAVSVATWMAAIAQALA